MDTILDKNHLSHIIIIFNLKALKFNDLTFVSYKQSLHDGTPIDIDPSEFRSIVVALQYLTLIRLDIT